MNNDWSFGVLEQGCDGWTRVLLSFGLRILPGYLHSGRVLDLPRIFNRRLGLLILSIRHEDPT